MSRLLSVVVGLGIFGAGTSAFGQGDSSDARIPSRASLARLGLERGWYGVVPLAGASDKVIGINLAEDMLFARTRSGSLHVFDAESGKPLWHVKLGNHTARPLEASANSDRVFVTNLQTLYCFDRKTGRPYWTRIVGAPNAMVSTTLVSDVPETGTAASEEFVTVALRSGRIQAFNVRDHTKDFPRGLSPSTLAWVWQTGGEVSGPAIITEHTVSFASKDERVYSARTNPNLLMYRFRTAGPIRAGLAGHGTRTLIVPCSDNIVYAIDLFTGDTKWTVATGAPVERTPLVAGDSVYALNTSGRLTAIDARDGQTEWVAETRAADLIAVGATKVYLSNAHHDLVIVDRKSGRIVADARATLDQSGVDLRAFSLLEDNKLNDRIYLASPSGFMVCLREQGQATPHPLRDPNEPKFGYVPKPRAADEPAESPADDQPAGDEPKP